MLLKVRCESAVWCLNYSVEDCFGRYMQDAAFVLLHNPVRYHRKDSSKVLVPISEVKYLERVSAAASISGDHLTLMC